jgi:hypothetical protein
MESLRVDRSRATLPGDAAAVQLDIGQDHSWLSSAYYANRQLGPAIAEREAELALYQRLARATPDDAVLQDRQMTCHRFLAELYLAAGSKARAQAELSRALAMIEGQRKLAPDSVLWRETAAHARVAAARLARLDGRLPEAQAQLDAAQALLVAQLQRDPEAWAWRVGVQERVAHEQAALLLQEHKPEQARHVLLGSQQRLQEAALEPSREARVLNERIANLALQGRLERMQGHTAEERAQWMRLLALAGGRERQLDGEATALLAEAMLRTGREDEGRRLLAALAAAGFRVQQAVPAGVANR